MKPLSTFFIIVAFIFLTGSHCKKSKADTGCGCNTNSVVHSFINRDGILYFNTSQNQNAWFITIEFPPYSQKYICRICNPYHSLVKAITDTMSANQSVFVLFSGKLTNLCPGESFGFQPANISPFYITIDSLKK